MIDDAIAQIGPDPVPHSSAPVVSVRSEGPPEEIGRVRADIQEIIRTQLERRLNYREAPNMPDVRRSRIELKAGHIQLSVAGLKFDEEEMHELEANVTDIVQSRLPLRDSSRAPFLCICASSGIPGTTLSLASINPLPPLPGNSTQWVIAVYLNSSTAIRMGIDERPRTNFQSNQCSVSLNSSVSSQVEIRAWGLCEGPRSSVYQSEIGPATVWTTMICTDQCRGTDTLVFRKPGFLGSTDEFNFDYTAFWQIFKGMEIGFTWLTT